MDKVFSFKTFGAILEILIIIFGYLLLGYTKLNPLDISVVLIGAFIVFLNKDKCFRFVSENRVYFILSTFFLLSVLLSLPFSYSKFEVLKNFIQYAAYLYLIPFLFIVDFDFKRYLRISFLLLGILLVLYSIPFFCSPKPVRLQILNVHPNSTGFIFSLIAILNIFQPTLFVFYAFVVSLTFSRASLLSLFISSTMLGILKRDWKVGILSIVPLIFMISMPTLAKFYKKSPICSYTETSKISKNLKVKPTDINIVRIYDMDRFKLWEASWKIFLKKPLFGVGSGNFNYALRDMCYKGELGEDVCQFSLKFEDSHNIFLASLMETGVIGFISFLTFFIYLFLTLLRNRKYHHFSILILLIGLSFLHPTVFFIRFIGVLSWFVLLEGVLNHRKFRVPKR